jgi:hypothetical protein
VIDDRESLLQALPPPASRAERPPARDDDRRLSLRHHDEDAAAPAPMAPIDAPMADESAEAPAPKRRGRPRKVVAETEPAAD